MVCTIFGVSHCLQCIHTIENLVLFCIKSCIQRPQRLVCILQFGSCSTVAVEIQCLGQVIIDFLYISSCHTRKVRIFGSNLGC